MSQILGKNIVIGVFMTDGYYPVFCGKTAELNVTQDAIETSTINTGSSREYESGMDSATLSISGITLYDNSSGRVSLFYLLQQRKTKFSFQMTLTDQASNIRVLQFTAILTRGNLTKDRATFSQSTADFQISGVINYDAVIAAPSNGFDVLSDYWTTTNGQSYISGASAIHSYTLVSTDTILLVTVEGTGYDIVTGTPVNRQVQFVTSPSVKLQFPTDLVFDGTQKVTVIFKR